jgi:hypothetical protein
MSEDALVEFRSFAFVHEAELAATALETAGIDCAVRERYMAGAQPELADALGGVALLVRAADVETARQILDTQKPLVLKAADRSDDDRDDESDEDEEDEGYEATCAGCGAPLRSATDACKECDAQPDRDLSSRPRSRWAIVKLKVGIIVVLLCLIGAPILLEKIQRLLGGVPEKTMSWVLYGGVAIVLAVILIKGLSSLSDRRI